MKTFKVLIVSGMFSLTLFSFTQFSSPSPTVSYPKGFRQWTHVKTGLIGPANPNFQFAGGFHHIYANEKAMQGYSTEHFPTSTKLI